jgi:hypothetical protein
MRNILVVFAVLLTGAASTPSVQQPSAQQSPDLSGTWVATKDAPTTVGAAPNPVFGERFALRLEGKNLALIRPVRGRTTAVTAVLPLDGSEVTVQSPSRPCLGQSAQVITMVWEEGALRYSIVGNVAPGATKPTRPTAPFNYRFRPQSAETLVIETTMRDSPTAEPKAVGTVYRRTAETLTSEPPPPPPVVLATIAQVSWISGDWNGALGTSAVEERWSPGNGGAMIGTSRTLRGDVMTQFEFLCISERNGTLVYTAMPNAGAQTDFTLTKIDADGATFENPEHNFPKLIRYTKREDGGMDAVISAGGTSKPTTFAFTRKR